MKLKVESNVKIEQSILQIIDAGKTEGNLYFLPAGQLERKVYVEVNKVLELLGGKWNKKLKAHLFESPIDDAISNVIATGEVTNHRKKLQFFETPRTIGDQMCDMLEYKGGKILEPNAGRGALLRAAEKNFHIGTNFANAEIFWFEIDEVNVEHALALKIGTRLGYDFLAEGKPGKYMFDRIIMNPPFSINGAGSQSDIDHVTHALKFLTGDGILVSVMSPAIKFRTNRKTNEFNALLKTFSSHEIIDLPENSFKESGTTINTVILKVRK